MSQIHSIDKAVESTTEWVKEVQKELNIEDSQETYIIVIAVLHALRDRMTAEEAVQFAAQLPTLLKGVFYEGWIPSKMPEKIKTNEDFYKKVNNKLPHFTNRDPIKYTEAVINVLSRKISSGEIEDIKRIFPKALLDLWPV